MSAGHITTDEHVAGIKLLTKAEAQYFLLMSDIY
jgi:hypothetical protein